VSKTFNLFISWSGERSGIVARFLRGWIQTVVQAARPWMSETDIEKGSRGLDEIVKALAGIKVGITCVTPENQQQPWILFEAGALSKSIDDKARLCTYLLGGLQPQDVKPPLGMFQAAKAEKEDTRKLVHAINSAVSDDPVPKENLDALFDAMWPKLNDTLATLPPPKLSVETKRPLEEMVAEILEIVRADANRKGKVGEYGPVLQELFPLLSQAMYAAREGVPISRVRRGHPAEGTTVVEPLMPPPPDTPERG